jgi:hypothetical protein
MFKRTLALSTPQLVGGYLNNTEVSVSFLMPVMSILLWVCNLMGSSAELHSQTGHWTEKEIGRSSDDDQSVFEHVYFTMSDIRDIGRYLILQHRVPIPRVLAIVVASPIQIFSGL